MKKNLFSKKRAFTVVEVIIAAAILSLIIIGVYTLYIGQQSGYVNQQKVLQLQHQMRIVLNKMVSDIRMAGYDPQESGNFGLVTTNANLISFTYDKDEDGTVDGNERYIYRINLGNIQISEDNGNTWKNLTWTSDLANVEAVSLNFTYYDASGVVTAVTQDVRIIKIEIAEKVKLAAAGDIYHTKTLSSRARVRNYD